MENYKGKLSQEILEDFVNKFDILTKKYLKSE